jgi:hypothetical protein
MTSGLGAPERRRLQPVRAFTDSRARREGARLDHVSRRVTAVTGVTSTPEQSRRVDYAGLWQTASTLMPSGSRT